MRWILHKIQKFTLQTNSNVLIATLQLVVYKNITSNGTKLELAKLPREMLITDKNFKKIAYMVDL